jgi:hypothetical protein
LQRTALEGQTIELRNASKFSALSQIADIMDRARERIESSHIVKTESDLLGAFTKGLPTWKVVLESKNPQLVQDHYQEWLKIEGLVRSYIASIAMALKIYLEYFVQVEFDRSQKRRGLCLHTSDVDESGTLTNGAQRKRIHAGEFSDDAPTRSESDAIGGPYRFHDYIRNESL